MCLSRPKAAQTQPQVEPKEAPAQPLPAPPTIPPPPVLAVAEENPQSKLTNPAKRRRAKRGAKPRGKGRMTLTLNAGAYGGGGNPSINA